MSYALLPLILFAALVWFVVRAIRKKRPLPVRKASGQQQLAPTLLQQPENAQPPESFLARWLVTYEDIHGSATTRVVRVVAVQPRLRKLQVWCEMRNGDRTLHFDGIRSLADAESGELIDMQSWLQAYARSRRTARSTEP